ncbi:L,D-transpeptidase family protein [Streptomyces broussonetiae]|uniref:L,D-transpeptidase family protein n=1 Tax=Streptomyces broussonetiae TaxID=2686304 RepID=A0A6I6NDI0_9ACTN|nr:L,D-transpeptidase family protein [Streptomyces broussonetiae]QHA09474.1 L,D-transpeptidase family protein [Streptomyces broussonetiae]
MTAAVVACGALLAALSGCGSDGVRPADAGGAEGPRHPAVAALPATDPTRIPGVGDRLQRQIPDDSGQVLAVYGDGEDSPDSTVVLYMKEGPEWRPVARWAAHNGRNGWTTDHHTGDDRTPVGVFGLSSAGGVLDDPGSRLPYDQNVYAYAPTLPGEAYEHVFDYVIAIDYNRRPGTVPHDPVRPLGDDKGGGIWLHLDHGDGTSACVSLPKEAMKFLLRTLDPDQHPVMVMGDRRELRA